MNFSTEKFIYPELEDLKAQVNLDEPIDYACDFIVARDDNRNILGVAGVNFHKNETPRFEHIIISPKYQKTKLAGVLMRRIDHWLRDLGYKFYNAFIFYDKELMRRYAKKWGMVETVKGNKGSWFTKELIPEEKYALV